MRALLCVLVLCVLGFSVGAAPTVRVPVYREQFVQLIVGSPGAYRTLRLDFASNDTLVLFQVPSSYSRSYVLYDGAAEPHGSELLYMGCHRMRVPVRYDATRLRYDTRVTYHGVLGFGERSHLWHHWQRYTLSSTTIALGDYDHSVVRFGYAPFSLQCRFGGYMNASIDAQRYRVHYEPGDPFTRLPAELYEHLDRLDVLLPRNTHLQLEYTDYMSTLPTGFDYSVLRKQPRGSRDVVLGEHTVRQLVSHNNVLERRRDIRPAYNLFDRGNTQPHFGTAAGIVLVSALVTWLLLVLSERMGDQVSLDILSHVELYGYAAAALLAWMEHAAFRCSRVLYHHMSCSERTAWPVYGVVLAAIVCNVLVGSVLALWRYRSAHRLWLRRAALETALSLALWLTQIDRHLSLVDHLLLLVVAAFYAVTRSMTALDSLLHRKPAARCAVTLCYAVAAHLFALVYTITPFLDRFFYGFPHRTSSAIMLWTVFVALPLLYLFTQINIAKLRNTLAA